jgi:hypothetical protein
MLRSVGLVRIQDLVRTDVSAESVASIFRIKRIREQGAPSEFG